MNDTMMILMMTILLWPLSSVTHW